MTVLHEPSIAAWLPRQWLVLRTAGVYWFYKQSCFYQMLVEGYSAAIIMDVDRWAGNTCFHGDDHLRLMVMPSQNMEDQRPLIL